MIHRRTIVTLAALLTRLYIQLLGFFRPVQMSLNRADASLPISSLITQSVTIWSAISTRRRRPVFG